MLEFYDVRRCAKIITQLVLLNSCCRSEARGQRRELLLSRWSAVLNGNSLIGAVSVDAAASYSFAVPGVRVSGTGVMVGV